MPMGRKKPLNCGEKGGFFMTNQQSVYLSRFSKEFWRMSVREFQSIRSLALAALFAALGVAVATLFIPLPVLGGQRIYFSFLIYAIGAILYGPLMGTAVGIVGDLVGAIFFPSGAFFIGYTITAAVSGFLYGLFFYRTRLSILRLALGKLSVNLIANTVLNSLWSAILAGNGFWILAAARLPKNLLMLPLEVLLLALLCGVLIPVLRKERLLSWPPFEKRLPWF